MTIPQRERIKVRKSLKGRLHPYVDVPGEHLQRVWLKRLMIWLSVRRDGSINLPVLHLLSLVLVVAATALGVYFMLALCHGFPHMGGHYRIICIIKDFITILVLRALSCSYLMRNNAAHEFHGQNVEEFEPGIFHFMRRLTYRYIFRREAPDQRWYSSFLGDHILLMLVGMVYVLGIALLPFLYWEALPADPSFLCWLTCIRKNLTTIFQALQGTYLAILLVGFLYVTLEHSAVFRPGHERGAKAYLMCFIVLWAPQFLLWYRVHEDLHERHAVVLEIFFQQFGAAPQIFITHSSAMVGAIMLGHSQHFHPCQDLGWRTSTRLVVAIGAYLAFDLWLEKGKAGGAHPVSMADSFRVAQVFPYMFLVVKGPVIVLCLRWVWKHGASGRHSGTRASAVGLGTDTRTLTHPAHGESFMRAVRSTLTEALDVDEERAWQQIRTLASNSGRHEGAGAHEGTPDFLDYDCALVMLTFFIASMQSLTRLYAYYSVREWQSWCSQFVGFILYDVSISYFVIMAWIQNPRKSKALKVGLWLGLLAAMCSVSNRSAVEMCLVNVAHNPIYGPAECCFYPGLADYNERKLDIVGHGMMTVSEACNKDLYGTGSHHGNEEGGHHEGHQHPHEAVIFAGADGSSHGSKHEGAHGGGEILVKKDEESTAYFFFMTLGSVGHVEFFFTLVGLFLKLILRLPFAGVEHHHGGGHSRGHAGGDRSQPLTFELAHVPSEGSELATVEEEVEAESLAER